MKLAFVLVVAVGLMSLATAQEKPEAQSKDGSKAKSMSRQTAAATDKAATIREALSAGRPEMAKTATVKDWDGNVLKQGDGPYTCFPTPPTMKKTGGKAPMCLDKTWQDWATAWQNKKDFKADHVAVGYMLEGDTGASNTDPYAQSPTSDNHWVVSGPHTMVLVPDASQLDAISDDPNNGGPFVMWKGTPYAHIMVPVGKKASGGMGQHAAH
jgi:hypothetical protein